MNGVFWACFLACVANSIVMTVVVCAFTIGKHYYIRWRVGRLPQGFLPRPGERCPPFYVCVVCGSREILHECKGDPSHRLET